MSPCSGNKAVNKNGECLRKEVTMIESVRGPANDTASYNSMS